MILHDTYRILRDVNFTAYRLQRPWNISCARPMILHDAYRILGDVNFTAYRLQRPGNFTARVP